MADQEQNQEQPQEENLEQLEQSVRDTEDQLLEGAFAPKEDAKPDTPAEPPPEQPAERKRDPATGQFVSSKPQAPPAAEGAPPPPAPEKPEDEVLPSWRAREINEERRAAQAENERLRVENARLTAWAQQQQRAAQPAAQPQLPDPVLDPAAYTKAVQDGLRREFYEKQMADRLENNLELTHAIHGEKFEKAFEALCAEGQRGNNALVRHMVSQPHPGRAIMAWFNDATMRREVGGDLDGYRKKLREELLNDPTFAAEYTERQRAVALGQVPQGQSKPNTVVKLPPSLSKATGSTDVPLTATDGSESAIFANAFTGPRRR